MLPQPRFTVRKEIFGWFEMLLLDSCELQTGLLMLMSMGEKKYFFSFSLCKKSSGIFYFYIRQDVFSLNGSQENVTNPQSESIVKALCSNRWCTWYGMQSMTLCLVTCKITPECLAALSGVSPSFMALLSTRFPFLLPGSRGVPTPLMIGWMAYTWQWRCVPLTPCWLSCCLHSVPYSQRFPTTIRIVWDLLNTVR